MPAETRIREARSPYLNVLLELMRKIARPYRRTFGELRLMQSVPEKAKVQSAEFTGKVTEFFERELGTYYKELPVISNTDHFPTEGSAFVVDICGSQTNLQRGRDDVLISVLLVKESTPTLALIYRPLTDEFITSEIGMGTRSEQGRMRVSGAINTKGSLVNIFGEGEELSTKISEFIKAGFTPRISGNMVYDALQTANGQADAFVLTNPTEFEKALTTLLIKEAGGHVKEEGTALIFSTEKLIGKL